MILSVSMFRRNLLLLVAALAAWIAVNVRSVAADPPKLQQLRVGAILALTGSAAAHGNAVRSGLEFAAEKLRSDGWTIDLAFEDDQTNPAKTVSGLQSLRSRGYSLFIGPTWSFQVEAARPIIAAAHAVAMIPASSADVSGGAAPGLFYLVPQRSNQTQVVTNFLKGSGAERMFVLAPAGGWGEVHSQLFRSAAQEVGITEVGAEIYDYGVDLGTFKALLLRAVQRKADLVATTGGAGDMANLLRARKELKLPLQILGTDTVWQAIQEQLVRPADAQSVAVFGLLVQSRFRDQYQQRYGTPPLIYTDYGYDALMTLAEAARETDGSHAAIDMYLIDQLDRTGASGPIDFNSDRINVGAPFQVLPATASTP